LCGNEHRREKTARRDWLIMVATSVPPNTTSKLGRSNISARELSNTRIVIMNASSSTVHTIIRERLIVATEN
jgi:hypothetical protein